MRWVGWLGRSGVLLGWLLAGTACGEGRMGSEGVDDAGPPAATPPDGGDGLLDAGARGAADAGADGPDAAGAGVPDGGGDAVDAGSSGPVRLCPSPLPAAWIFCDDFETGDVASRYFEFGDDDGDFRRVDTQAASGAHSMEVVFQPGEVSAGGMKVTFGRNPIGSRYRTGEDFVEVYWRMRVMHQVGWTGSPAKLSRATAFSGSDWSQAMIAHLWSRGDVLIGDPAGCVSGSSVRCRGYNDFGELAWLGQMRGETPIFSTADAGRWRCVEGHVRLNTPGARDGVFELWIDDRLEARRTDLDWRGSWTSHGINAVFFENYWNDGSPVEQRRWFDDVAIATERIGCE